MPMSGGREMRRQGPRRGTDGGVSDFWLPHVAGKLSLAGTCIGGAIRLNCCFFDYPEPHHTQPAFIPVHLQPHEPRGANIVSIVTITQENFNETINNNGMVILDFWAPWCGPCRSFAPVFEQTSEQHPDVVFAKINTEEQQELAGAFQIRSIPTLMIFRDQIIIFSQPGALPASAFEELITKAKALDMDAVRGQIASQKTQAAGAE